MTASWEAQKAWLDDQSNVPPVDASMRLGRMYATAEQLLMQAKLYLDAGNHAMGYIFCRRWLKLCIGKEGVPGHPKYAAAEFAPKAAAAKKANAGVYDMAVRCRDACKATFEEAERRAAAPAARAGAAGAVAAGAAGSAGASAPPPPAEGAPPAYPGSAAVAAVAGGGGGGGGGTRTSAAGVSAAFAALKMPGSSSSSNPSSPRGGGAAAVASQTRTLYDSVAPPSWMPGGGGPPLPPAGTGAGAAAFAAASSSAAAQSGAAASAAASAATAAAMAAAAAPQLGPMRTGSLRQHWLPPAFAQSTIDGREGSSACFIIAFLLCRAHLMPGNSRPRLPSAAAGEAACPPAWFAFLKERMRQGNHLYDLIQGNGRFFDFDDLGVYFDVLMRTGQADLTGLEVAEQLPVFLDASPAREAEISDERKLRSVLERFANEPANVAAVWTIAGTSMAILGGENGSFFLFDSHSHPYRNAGACTLTGGRDADAAAAASAVMSQFTRVNQPDAAVGTLTTFKRMTS